MMLGHTDADEQPLSPRTRGLEIVKRANGTPFLVKLWQMLAATENDDIIGWASDGKSFEVKAQKQMAKVLLPKYFRHSKFSSFQRQLNYFGFSGKMTPKAFCGSDGRRTTAGAPRRARPGRRQAAWPPSRSPNLGEGT